jgi:CheY-like chemotaxis protein
LNLRKQILIVDDEIFNIEAAKITLDCSFSMKYIDNIVQIAMNGQDALEKV